MTAAGAWIGRATALAFAAEGAPVIATDLVPDALERLEEAGIETRGLDVTDAATVEATARQVGAADILFNCAGHVHHGSIPDCDEEAFDFSVRLNLRGTCLVTRAFLPAPPALSANRWGASDSQRKSPRRPCISHRTKVPL